VQLVFGLDPGADQGGRDERMKRKGEEEEERGDDPPLHVYARFTTGWIEFFFSSGSGRICRVGQQPMIKTMVKLFVNYSL